MRCIAGVGGSLGGKGSSRAGDAGRHGGAELRRDWGDVQNRWYKGIWMDISMGLRSTQKGAGLCGARM